MRKSTLSTITLAALLCFSTNNYVLVGSAYAATKSAISPDINLSQPSTPTIQSQPAIAPVAPTSIDIKIENSAAPAKNFVDNREPVQLEPERLEPARSQPVEIVIENRSTGCQFKASSLLERNANLCNPEVEIAANQNKSVNYSQNSSENSYQNSDVVYAATSGDTKLQVRRLTALEIAAMSLPSNGDKRMLFPLISPSTISSLFGSRVHPVTGQVRFHQGTDLAAPEGTPVVAAFSGRVEIAGWLGGYGLIVVISHGDTHETRYAHLSEVLVKQGQVVKQGNVIGLVGSTGLATGPHLHFEIWRKMQEGLVAVDPTPQLMIAMEQLQKYLATSRF
jgi:murein DD-endopeptidase MepM/ murein hydrolase activator NlpD